MFKRQVLFILILVGGLGCSQGEKATPGAIKPQVREMIWDEKIKKFSNCQEMISYIQSTQKSDELPVQWNSINSPPQHYSHQVEDLQEGDILQSNEKNFFFLRRGSIEILERSTLRLQKSIPLFSNGKQKLVLSNTQLIYIADETMQTLVKVFELDNFRLSLERKVEGSLLDFRLSDNQLIIVGQKKSLPLPEFGDCTNIYYPNMNDLSQSFSFVHILNLKDEKLSRSIGLGGSAHHLFMTKDEILLFTDSTDSQFSSAFVDDSRSRYLPSHFRVIRWQEGEPQLQGVVVYSGVLKDRWSVSRAKNSLFLALSKVDQEGQKVNHIQVFQKQNESYRFRSESEKFGVTEDIRAVSYRDAKAYVVTFQKTDPLYVIDLSDVDRLRIVAEVKAPGFSTQLRSLDENLWAGLGYQASPQGDFSWFGGLQFSIFNLQNLRSPFEAARLQWGSRGSSSEATSDSKALFSTKNQERMMFPIVLVRKENEGTSPEWESGRLHEFSGAIILDFQRDQVKEAGRLSHREWREKYCGRGFYFELPWWSTEQESADIQRIIQIDQSIYTFSRFGVMWTDSSSLAERARLEFENSNALCFSTERPSLWW